MHLLHRDRLYHHDRQPEGGVGQIGPEKGRQVHDQVRQH